MLFCQIKRFFLNAFVLIANVRKCFSQDSYATLSDGSHKKLDLINVGDKVKTLDSNGTLIDTDVIMIMDKSSEKCKNIILQSTPAYLIQLQN